MLYFKTLLSQLHVALFAALCLAAAPAGATDWSDTCRFFSNAAFKDRHVWGETTFRMQLAQDCVDARLYAGSDNPYAARRAEAYLTQLEAYRAVLVAMLVDRARERPRASEDDWGYQKWRPAVHPISRAGAYLIARDMGVVDTHQAWTSWRQSATGPLFRLNQSRTY